MNIINTLWINQEKIVKRYKSGESCKKISKDYNCNSGYIYIFLRDKIKCNMHESRKNYGKTNDNIDKIIELFNNGLSATKIAKTLGLSKRAILRKMKLLNLDSSRYSTIRENKLINSLEEIVKLYNDGYSMSKLAEKYNTNSGVISTMFKTRGIKARRQNEKYTCNYNFFEKIDTPEKAYTLGWMYSDGNVGKRNGINRIQCVDKEILVKLNNILQNTCPIRELLPPKRFPYRKTQYVLTFYSVKMSKDLINLGCMPNKSLILKFPTEEQVPVHLLSHFVRGYFDGDGSVYLAKQHNFPFISIVGTNDFLRELVSKITLSSYEIYKRHPRRNTSTRTLRISRKDDVLNFLTWIYQNSSVSLDRKYTIVKKYI